jgi:hypothetical protein
MDAQLFIRTWEGDLGWLKFCLKSVRQFWQSAFQPVIVATPECYDNTLSPPVFKIRDVPASIFVEPKWNDTRRGAVYIGLNADQYTTAETILFTDSDCLFTRKCSADDMMQDGKICLYGNPYAKLMVIANPPDHNCFTWYRRVCIEVLGIDPVAEYMRRHPFMFYRSTLEGFRNEVTSRMKVSLRELMERYHSGYFSEFNLLSAYALKYQPDLYTFVDIMDARPPFVRQFHSWSQDTTSLDVGREVKAILK